MPPDIAAQLRDAIRQSGKTALQLAKESGIPQPTISRFLNGADMRLSRAAKIAEVLRIELRTVKK